jgi:hypothetical protein
MKTRQLGNSDLFITPVGYGSWAIGGSGWQFAWGKQNDDDSIAAIHRALEFGVNWIDTAAVYGIGHSEEIVARALASWRGPQPYVFTKCGLRWDAQGQTRRDLTKASIRKEWSRTFTNWKKGGARWRSCSGKARRAGLAFQILMPNRWSGRKPSPRSPLCSRLTRWFVHKWSRRSCRTATNRKSARSSIRPWPPDY